MIYNFSYTTTASTGAPIDVTLQLTLDSFRNSDGSYQIDNITGEWNGQLVLALAAGDGSAYGSPNNLFYPNNDSPASNDATGGYASFFGFGFTVDTSGPGAIAGDDGQGSVYFDTGSGPGGDGDGELISNANESFVYAPATNETLTPACYCTGTLIRTPRGDVPVEQLAAGDLVETQDGSAQPVLWIGRRSYGGRFLAGRDELYPVRIEASALGDGVPSRDLLVSQKHAMYLGGLLVPAGELVNGSTITIDRRRSRVDYLHIELASHNVVWAENAASETFVDDDSRGTFHNAAEYAGPESSGPMAYYAPRVSQGFQLEAIRRSLPASGNLAVVA